ncbi:MAG TPA: DUF6178 family protein, partial [Anaeromyxobacteraceae bacterium]|nr:DUF6178 family protein [Anaeromyxobacteraceae bacterium]
MGPKERRERSLAPEELQRHRADLAKATGRRRLDLILDARAPQALVRALPADELYLAIRDVGLADAAPLVGLASAEQFQVLIDLDAWRSGEFDPSRALPWLRAARAGALDDPRAAARWARKLATLDREVLFLALRRALRVHELEENEPEPELESDRFLRTPENKFIVEFLVEGTEYLAVKGILDDLYAENAFEATRLLSAIRWELDSDLTEAALRWRAGRLADLGFPSLEEALSWFAKPPAAQGAERPGRPARPPGFWIAAHPGTGLFDRAAARLSDGERAALEPQLVEAANAVVVADAIDPGDVEAVARALAAARALIELGLEQRAGADEEKGAAALAEVPVKRLFQEGFGRLLALKWRADRLFREQGAGTRQSPLLDPPLGEALAALALRRPRFHPGLEAGQDRWGAPALAAFLPRPFLGSADLGRAAAALDAAEALLALGGRLGLLPPPGAPAGLHRLSARYLTALANERLGRAF